MASRQDDNLRSQLRLRVRDRLGSVGIECAEVAASPTQLVEDFAARGQTLNRVRVHRYIGSLTTAVVEVAEEMFSIETANLDATLRNLVDTWDNNVRDGTAGTIEQRKATLRQLLAFNYEAQFTNEAMPGGWLLHAALIEHSPAWRHETIRPPDDERHEAAERIRCARAKFYDAMCLNMERLLRVAIHAMGRRFLPGVRPGDVVAVMNAMHDGMVLRAVLDPRTWPSERVAEVLFDFAWSQTMPATQAMDEVPLRNAAVVEQRTNLAQAAADLVCAGRELSWESVGRRAKLPPQTASILFDDDIARLADAALRVVIPISDLEVAGSPFPLQFLRTELMTIADHADANPTMYGAVTPLDDAVEGIDVLADVAGVIASILEAGIDSGLVLAGDPRALSRSLVRFAVMGAGGRAAVEALLDTATPIKPDQS